MISIGSNINALQAQRQLGKSSDALSKVFERLSSGLRINHASDDAAGMAISLSLNLDSRVFSQGMRNVNDGISFLNIASGALDQLSQIATRQLELATQAANGTFSKNQRGVMTTESNALSDEFNRILGSTKFNGCSVLDGSLISGLRIQEGYSSVSYGVGGNLARKTGDGSAAASTTYASSGVATLSDINGDGKLDLISAGSGGFNVQTGKGDGTFNSTTFVSTGGSVTNLVSGDFNGDGKNDVVLTSGTSAYIFVGNGNGTFLAPVSYTATSFALGTGAAQAVDVNGDGKLDLAFADPAGGKINVLISNGDGTFQAMKNSSDGTGNTQRVTFADYNGDGILDVASSGTNVGTILFGNGDGTFKAPLQLLNAGGGSITATVSADFNHDGIQDLSFYTSTGIVNLLGNGDGTFRVVSTSTPPAGSGSNITAVDFNGDGNIDLIEANGAGNVGIFLGNGDGTFQGAQTYATGVTTNGNVVGDLNGDGAMDLLSFGTSGGNNAISLGNVVQTTSVARVDMFTQQTARNAMQVFRDTLDRISLEQGTLGSAQSRLAIGVNHLASSRENFLAADSRITSSDIASDTADLTRFSILKQAGAAILSQVNQNPLLALRLIQEA